MHPCAEESRGARQQPRLYALHGGGLKAQPYCKCPTAAVSTRDCCARQLRGPNLLEGHQQVVAPAADKQLPGLLRHPQVHCNDAHASLPFWYVLCIPAGSACPDNPGRRWPGLRPLLAGAADPQHLPHPKSRLDKRECIWLRKVLQQLHQTADSALHRGMCTICVLLKILKRAQLCTMYSGQHSSLQPGHTGHAWVHCSPNEIFHMPSMQLKLISHHTCPNALTARCRTCRWAHWAAWDARAGSSYPASCNFSCLSVMR